MKKLQLFILLVIIVAFSCKKEDSSNATPPPSVEDEKETFYDREKNRMKILDNNDLVLLYSGGSHRTHQWNEEHVEPYVTYIDESGKEHWMFDSFLFLEIHNGDGQTFVSGMGLEPANRYNWRDLVDHYFQSRYCLGALNRSIRKAIERMGAPAEKHKIVMGIPEPIINQKDWGSLADGALDFSSPDDRVEACKWYIDYVRSKFNELDYEHLELSGFYWISEAATDSRGILPSISSYLNDLKYGFIWIPYNGADGAFQWKQLTFNYAYFQPNYFFDDNTPLSLLNWACESAIKYNMDMEIEFDHRALAEYGWGYRLENYMDAFIEYGIWDNNRIAYYQGDKALYDLFRSDNIDNIKLYHKFSKFVSERSKQ